MRGFLLDSHVPATVAPAVRRLIPDCVIHHLASWNEGVLLHAADEQILTAALGQDLTVVTYDISSIPPILNRWAAEGRRLPSVVLVNSGNIPQQDIGGLARGLADLHRHPEQFDPAYPVVYLQRSHE